MVGTRDGGRPHADARPARAAERSDGEKRRAHDDAAHPPVDDPLDPTARQTAQLAAPISGGPNAAGPAGVDAPAARARSSLEDLLPALVRKVAWSGDGRRGAIRLELGAGAMAGASVVVESDDGRVRVRLSAPDGVDPQAWRARVAGRLARRGLDVEAIDVE